MSKTTDLEGESLVILELYQKNRLLVVHRHELTLCKTRAAESNGPKSPNWGEKGYNSQASAVKTGYQIRYTFSFDTNVGGENVIANGECCRDDEQF